MKPRINLITLGVQDLTRARQFYETGLGWKVSSAGNESVVFLQLDNLVLSLFSRDELAKDAHVENTPPGFSGITLAHNVHHKEEVAQVLQQAEQAGATILKPAQDVFWGGHAGYFADPEGHLWEVAWNPFFPMDEAGTIQLP